MNRKVSDTSVVLTKRKSFDFLVERPFLKKSRGDWQKLEPAVTVQPFVIVFMRGPDPNLTRIAGMVG